MPAQRRSSVVVACLVGIGLVAGAAAGLGAAAGPGAAPAVEPATTRHLPELQSTGYTTLPLRAGRLAGIIGFGRSTIDLQNAADAPNDVTLTLWNLFDDERRLTRRLAPRGWAAVELWHEAAITLGRHSAVVAGSAPLAAVGRTAWSSGAAVAYEAPEAARSLVLPLMVRNVYSHTTLWVTQNTDDGDEPNEVTYQVFDNASGELLRAFTAKLAPGATHSYDTMTEEEIFGALPTNAGDGFVGALRVSAEKPVALLAYGEESLDDGNGATSAYVARPAAAAAASQLLPVVRANFLGDTVVAVASLENAPVEVTVTYRGLAASPSGAGATFVQTLQIGPRGATSVDLSQRGALGTAARASVPRGAGLNTGFVGSASLVATGRILAVALERLADGGVRAESAYNAFGPADLAPGFVVPVVPPASGGRRTLVAVTNPGTESVAVVVRTEDVAGAEVDRQAQTLAAGETRLFELPAGAAVRRHAEVTASAPVAALVLESAVTGRAEWGAWGADAMAYLPVPMRGAAPTPGPTPSATASPSPAGPTPAPTRTTSTPGTPPIASPTSTPVCKCPWIAMPVAYRRWP